MVVSKPNTMLGKPVIEGTRITVENILEKLAAGLSHDEILEAYPRLSEQDIYDALAFAVHALGTSIIYPTPLPPKREAA